MKHNKRAMPKKHFLVVNSEVKAAVSDFSQLK